MTLTSTLGSPGIEIREIDNSIRMNATTATTVFVPGFANQGPIEEVISIGTMGDFELIYGTPTNAAERYFYYTVKSILDNSGAGVSVLTSRLPYGKAGGDSVSNAYTLLAYPAVPVMKKKHVMGTPIINSDKYVSTTQGSFGDNKVTVLSKTTTLFDGKNKLTVNASKDAAFTEISVECGVNKLENTTYQLISTKDITTTTLPSGEQQYKATAIYKITCTDALYDENTDTKVELIVEIPGVDCHESGALIDTTTIPEFKSEIKIDKALNADMLQTITYDGEVDSDCLIFSDLNGFNNLFSADNASFNEKDSSYEIFVNDTITEEEITASFNSDKDPIIVSTDAINKDEKAPSLVFSLVSDGATKEIKMDGKIRVEKIDTKTVLYLTYQSTDTPRIVAMFKLVYDSVDGTEITFNGSSSSSSSVKFLQAYEIMEDGYTSSYEGVVPDRVEKDKKITYVVGAPTMFNISLKDYYDIITGEFFTWDNKWQN